MKAKNSLQGVPLLADMHMDGVRFDPKIKDAVRMHDQEKNARVISDIQNR